MITLESNTPGLSLTGLEPAVNGSVVAVVPIANGAVQVLYKTLDDNTINASTGNDTDPDRGDSQTVRRTALRSSQPARGASARCPRKRECYPFHPEDLTDSLTPAQRRSSPKINRGTIVQLRMGHRPHGR